MDALMAPRPPRRPSLLHLLRSFFGHLRNVRGEPRVEEQELGALGDGGGHDGDLAGQQPPYWEPWEGEEGESTEPLLGELGGLSLAGSLGSSTSRSCLTWSTSDTELACDVGDTPAGSPALPHAGHGLASQEGTAMPEAFCDKALETDEFLQGLGAGGDVTCSASPEPMFFVDFDAECEKERLLKDDRAGSPTAELSQGNMLFNTTRHRWTSHEPQAPGSSKELEGEEEPLLNAVGNRPATPVLLPPAPDPSDAVPAGRFSEERAGEARGCFGRSWVLLGAGGGGTPGKA